MSEFDFPALGDASAPFQTRENLVTAVRAAIDARGDALQDSIDAISGGVLVVGEWDASSGAFPTTRPGGAAIQVGDAFVVSTGGTVDSVVFAVADRLIAIAATGGATYAGNWVTAAYSDLLASPIAQSTGGTGASSLGAGLVTPTGGQSATLAAHLGALAGVATPMTRLGLAGDGSTDDTTALNAALALGVPLDGLGLTYAVTGNITLPAGTDLRNVTIKQLAPAGAGDVRTLTSSAANNIRLSQVTVDRNGDGTNGQLSLDAGIWIAGGSGHSLVDCTVTGDDMGAGIVLDGVTASRLVSPLVYAMNYDLGADPTDDRVQGIWIKDCSFCTVWDPTVRDLGGDYGIGATVRYSRGIVVSGCSEIDIVRPVLRRLDQGLDLTGSTDNTRIRVLFGTASQIRLFGFKAANAAHDVLFLGCDATNCGLSGFVASGPAEEGLNPTQWVQFVACTARNPGNANLSGDSAPALTGDRYGFNVQSGSFDTDFPRGVSIIGCEAHDTQSVKTMTYGARCEPTAQTSGPFNTLSNFKTTGFVTAATVGFHAPVCEVVRSTDQSAANATWVTVDWESATDNTGAMWASGANSDTVYIRDPGRYQITFIAAFAADATGSRSVRLDVGGSTDQRSEVLGAAPTAGSPATVQTSRVLALAAGTTIKAQVNQSSGGALNIVGTRTFLHVMRVSE